MNRSEIFGLLRRRWGASLVVAGYVLGAGQPAEPRSCRLTNPS